MRLFFYPLPVRNCDSHINIAALMNHCMTIRKKGYDNITQDMSYQKIIIIIWGFDEHLRNIGNISGIDYNISLLSGSVVVEEDKIPIL